MENRNRCYIVVDGNGNAYGLPGTDHTSKQRHADTLNAREGSSRWTVAITNSPR